MRGIIIFAVLVSAVAGYRSSGYISQQSYTRPKDVADLPAKESTTSTTGGTTTSGPTSTSMTSAVEPTSTTTTGTAAAALQSTSINPASEIPMKGESTAVVTLEEIVSDLPITLSPVMPDEELSKRRVITYDQRQEGQYNIRADLENFMIVLIPPSPTDGLNLLDLLTKSTLRRNSLTAKGKRKHYTSSASLQSGSPKYRQSIKGGSQNQNFNYLSRQSPPNEMSASRGYSSSSLHSASHSQPLASSVNSVPDFVEGRTPYHVDISANDEEQLRLHPDRQVDVLPPPYPLAYQHLIKPFHLEAEPTVIQALPPSDISGSHSTGNFLETYNQLLSSGLQGNTESNSNVNSVPENNGYYRISRAIRTDNLLDSNRVTSSNSLNSYPERRSHVPIYRSDLSFGAAQLYPPIDAPRLTGYLNLNSNSRTLELNPDDAHEQNLEDAHIGEIIVPSGFVDGEDDIESDLHGVSFIDSAKALLSDGMERCAPGRRRDSYGVCREIEGY